MKIMEHGMNDAELARSRLDLLVKLATTWLVENEDEYIVALHESFMLAMQEADASEEQANQIWTLALQAWKAKPPTTEARKASITTCEAIIIWDMEASGPQSRGRLYRVCEMQAVPFSPALFESAIESLLTSGRIVDTGVMMDFPDSYYEAESND